MTSSKNGITIPERSFCLNVNILPYGAANYLHEIFDKVLFWDVPLFTLNSMEILLAFLHGIRAIIITVTWTVIITWNIY